MEELYLEALQTSDPEARTGLLQDLSTEIVDILKAAGLESPDISILSDEFLLEVQQMEKKNLGLEALRKLLNDSIRSRTRTNVVETRAFTERLEDAIASALHLSPEDCVRYAAVHAWAASTDQFLATLAPAQALLARSPDSIPAVA